MGYEFVEVKIRGVAPLLMHNARLANPIDEIVRQIKQITSKRKKTDTDLEELARLEFLGGLYLDEKGRPAIPGECIEGTIRDGAKKTRKGKDVQCGVLSDGVWPLEYDGPKDQHKLWADPRFRDYRGCKVNNGIVMRMRPRFGDWALTFRLAYHPEVVSPSSLEEWVRTAGQFVGLCDFRPKYGRFNVESFRPL